MVWPLRSTAVIGSGNSATKVASGAYDVGIADLGAVIALNAKQGGIKLISIYQIYDVAPLVNNDIDRKRHQEARLTLRARSWQRLSGDSSRVMFPVFARVNNIDPSSIEWIDVTPPLRSCHAAAKKGRCHHRAVSPK